MPAPRSPQFVAADPVVQRRSSAFEAAHGVYRIAPAPLIHAATGSSSSAEASLDGALFVRIVLTAAAHIRFGKTGMGAAAADATSHLFPAGEFFVAVPLDTDGTPMTHIRHIQSTAAGIIQVAKVL